MFTCCAGGNLRPKHEEFEGSRHLGYSTARTLIQQHENYGRLSSRMQVTIGPTYQGNLSKWSTATWSEVRMWLRRSWLEFMRSTHTLWNMTVYDGDAVCEVLPASEGQALLQDLPSVEGIWKQVVSGHTHCISISWSRYLVGDSRATQDRSDPRTL